MRVPNLVPIGPQAATCIRPEGYTHRQTDRQTDTHTLSYIDIDDKVITDKTAIANAFNTYFTHTVKTSTTELNTPSNKTFKYYMNEEHTH